MICEDCRFADEYIAWWWYPSCNPTCLKGHGIFKNKEECENFEQIGRLSR